MDVSDDSGIRGLKVLAWPASSKLDLTDADLRSVDSAKCRSTSDETTRCAYGEKVTKQEAADLAKGTWYVSVLATAEDGARRSCPMLPRSTSHADTPVEPSFASLVIYS
ncbi:hypothetical protein GCM10010306_091450 [Streptomyces umbrinus]|nr:hypothetical protein GCM10010306_091450 [Streptomyces umbrinus]